MLPVGPDAAAGQRPPQPQGGGGLLALHPLGRDVADLAVLQAEDQGGGLVVTEQGVVPVVDPRTALEGWGERHPLHQGAGQRDGLDADLLPGGSVEDLRDEGGGGPVQSPLHFHGRSPAQRCQPALDLPEGAPDPQSGEGGRRRHHRGSGRGQRAALGRAAPLVGAAVGPVPAAGDAERLHHGHVERAAGQPDALGQRPQPGHHPLGALVADRILAEEDDDPVGLGAVPLTAPHEAVGDLAGGVLPFSGDRGNADAEPAAETPALAVHGDHDEGVGRVETEHVGQRVGQFRRAAQGDPRVGGGSGRAGGGPVGRGA